MMDTLNSPYQMLDFFGLSSCNKNIMAVSLLHNFWLVVDCVNGRMLQLRSKNILLYIYVVRPVAC